MIKSKKRLINSQLKEIPNVREALLAIPFDIRLSDRGALIRSS